jgi:uncharacterized protein (TIGR00369 family)
VKRDVSDLERIAPLAGAPIGKWLNFSADIYDNRLRYRLAFAERHIGNPLIRALHGGCIAAFLELVMQAELAAALTVTNRISTASIAVDYLTSSRAQDMLATARILRLGRRIAFAEATGWQLSEDQPVATARAAFRLG